MMYFNISKKQNLIINIKVLFFFLMEVEFCTNSLSSLVQNKFFEGASCNQSNTESNTDLFGFLQSTLVKYYL